MRPQTHDSETLREEILKAGKECARQGIFMTVKALRQRGVKGNETRIYKVRKQLVDEGLLPSHLIREHPVHRSMDRHKPVRREMASLPDVSSLTFTQQMVRLYGRRRLRRENKMHQTPSGQPPQGLPMAFSPGGNSASSRTARSTSDSTGPIS